MKRVHETSVGVLSLLQERMSRLSKSERMVAEYLLKHPNNINVLSITDLAACSGVSEATVVRFARRLGFAGFIDFKRALLEELLRKSEDVLPEYEEVEISDDPETVLAKLFALHKRTIDLTEDRINSAEFAEAAQRVAKASSVQFYGHGGSGYILQSVAFQFLKTGIRCTVWVDESTQDRSAKLLEKTDVVIALSHTGEAPGVIHAARMAKALGVFVISITNSPASSLAETSDIVLPTHVGQTRIGAEAGASRIAQLAILDALTVSAAVLRKQQEQLF